MTEITVLGKNVVYLDTGYNPGVLVRLLRSTNRLLYGIELDKLPFSGYDIWNCYLISAISSNGIPFVYIGRLIYNCNSKYIVLSKSLKLYLNSFNMTKISLIKPFNGEITEKNMLESIVKEDLSNLLLTNVLFRLYDLLKFNPELQLLGILNTPLLCKVDFSKVVTDKYTESPLLLQTYLIPTGRVNHYNNSNIIRSNCKITHQPDWGTVVIYYKSDKLAVTDLSLLSYLISFRKENHFHELVCLMIYTRLYEVLKPEILEVTCYYTRRGGIDINPHRSSWKDLDCLSLFLDLYDYKLPRQ